MKSLVPFVRELDTLFDAWSFVEGRPFCPAMDVSEEEGSYRVDVDLPGVKPEDVDVTVEGGELVIKGERKVEKKGVHRSERTFGSFVRTISVGRSVDSENITATYKDGILSISIPKSKEARAKKIDVKVLA